MLISILYFYVGSVVISDLAAVIAHKKINVIDEVFQKNLTDKRFTLGQLSISNLIPIYNIIATLAFLCMLTVSDSELTELTEQFIENYEQNLK